MFLLVKHPLGGYGESLLSAGEKMRSLAYFEAKVVEGEPVEVRVRGSAATDAQLLLQLYRDALQLNRVFKGSELVCEVAASLDVDPEIASDPDFWPRMILLPGNHILFRGRTPEEIVRCAKVMEFIARSDYQVDPSKWSSDVVIPDGTIHHIGLHFDPQCIRRVAAKIAYALFRTIAKYKLQPDDDERMRSYILGLETSVDEPVWTSPDPLTWTTSNDPHIALLSPEHDETAAFVSLYGSTFRVELLATLSSPAGVICEIDGSGMRFATKKEIYDFTTKIKQVTFSRPWLESETGSVISLEQ